MQVLRFRVAQGSPHAKELQTHQRDWPVASACKPCDLKMALAPKRLQVHALVWRLDGALQDTVRKMCDTKIRYAGWTRNPIHIINASTRSLTASKASSRHPFAQKAVMVGATAQPT